jgi:hypothetical protein
MHKSIKQQAKIITARVWDMRQYLWRRSQEQLRKYEIINALITKYKYKSYLEICTPTTGRRFRRVCREKLETCHLLVYRNPESSDDDGMITFQSRDEAIEHLIAPGSQYDLVFADSWHTYACTARDIALAFSLVKPGGILVVHDCAPQHKERSSPEFRPDGWTGVSYCAYVDFLLANPGLAYYTVDTDFGCGVVRKDSRAPGWTPQYALTSTAAEQWRRERSRNANMFDVFEKYKRELLNLISVEEFLALEAVHAPLNLRLDKLLPQLAKHPFSR